jgi:hypothetical protein
MLCWHMLPLFSLQCPAQHSACCRQEMPANRCVRVCAAAAVVCHHHRTCVGQHPGLRVAWHVHLDSRAAAVEGVPLKIVHTLQGNTAATHATQNRAATAWPALLLSFHCAPCTKQLLQVAYILATKARTCPQPYTPDSTHVPAVEAAQGSTSCCLLGRRSCSGNKTATRG